MQAAFAIEDNVRNVADYVQLVLEIIDIIRNALKIDKFPGRTQLGSLLVIGENILKVEGN